MTAGRRIPGAISDEYSLWRWMYAGTVNPSQVLPTPRQLKPLIDEIGYDAAFAALITMARTTNEKTLPALREAHLMNLLDITIPDDLKHALDAMDDLVNQRIVAGEYVTRMLAIEDGYEA